MNPMFRITRHIWQGRFPTTKMLAELQRAGITHLFNVGESPSVLTEADGFRRVKWLPMEDLVRIPTAQAIETLDALHACVRGADRNVYIHCVAGWNRSPTVLWLYLVACGMDGDAAKQLITAASFDAVPAHAKLIDQTLVAEVLAHGQRSFLPHPRAEALDVKWSA